jgi:hypothetical protein
VGSVLQAEFKLNRISVDTKIFGKPKGESFCVSSFYPDQVPGSTFRSTKVYGGMPREDPGSDGDSGLRKHLKETIGSLHRMARQNAIN